MIILLQLGLASDILDQSGPYIRPCSQRTGSNYVTVLVVVAIRILLGKTHAYFLLLNPNSIFHIPTDLILSDTGSRLQSLSSSPILFDKPLIHFGCRFQFFLLLG